VNLSQPRRRETLARKRAIAEIKAALGVPQLTVEARPAEVRAQESPYKVSFETALELAIRSFLENGDNNESPSAVIASRLDVFGLPNDADAATIKEKVRQLMNDARSSLVLLRRTQIPEGGERVAENWIFNLRLPDDDHLYWAVVDRISRSVYNYGFN